MTQARGYDDVDLGATAPRPAGVDEDRVVRKVVVRLLPVLAVAYFFNSLEKSNIGLAALQMNQSLGLTEAAFGLASGLLFIGYAVFEVPSNLAMYRFGARRWMSRIMITWGIIAAATAFVQGPTSLYVVRILLGVAEAGFYPGVVLYLSFWIPKERRGQVFAMFVFGGTLAGVIGSPLSGLLLTPATYFGFDSWRAMFIVEGIPAVLVGLVCLAVLRDKPADAAWLTEDERTWLQQTMDAERDGVASTHAHASKLRSLADVRVLMLSFIYFCGKFGQYALTFFLPLIIAGFQHGAGTKFTTLQIGLLAAIPAAATVAPSILWARHSDRTRERIRHAGIPLIVASAGVLVSAAFSGSPLLVMISVSIATLAIGSQSAAFYQIPSTFLTGAAAAATFGLINSLGNLGGFVAPVVFGAVKDATGTYVVPSCIMAAVLLLGGILTLLFPRMFRSPQPV